MPLIYNLLTEILAIQIRNNPAIKGIRIGDRERKLVQFADDLNLFLKFEKETLDTFQEVLHTFEGATALKVNYDKTSIYRIGSLANSNATMFTQKPFNWTNGPVKILGIILDYDQSKMQDLNVQDLLDRTAYRCQRALQGSLLNGQSCERSLRFSFCI